MKNMLKKFILILMVMFLMTSCALFDYDGSYHKHLEEQEYMNDRIYPYEANKGYEFYISNAEHHIRFK